MNEPLIFLNALNRISFLGPVRIGAIIRYCGSSRVAWSAPASKLEQIPELKGLVEKLLEERRRIDPDAEWRRLQNLKINCLTLDNPAYPSLLKQITHPPPLLYYRGSWVNQPAAVAIVGSRRCTVYGREVARRLAGELALAGVTVVSGLALGVDTAAHQGALGASGQTVAVLGCGLDRCYPPSNVGLMRAISAGGGAVLSEFPLDTKPLPQHFPQRNRIISGLSLGTVVVEATVKSGALITANYALEQNREVFAVPGHVDSPYSRGCHRLLKEGARLVESCADILEEFQMIPAAAEAETAAGSENICTGAEESLFKLISHQPLHIDQLIHSSGLNAEQVAPLLLELELKGLVRQLPGKYFSRQ